MLKSNPTLKKLRYHYIMAKSKEQVPVEPTVTTFSYSLNKKLGKILDKAKETLTGSSAKLNKKSVIHLNDSEYLKSEELVENDSELSSVSHMMHNGDFPFDRTFESTLPNTLKRSRRSSM